VHPLIQRSQCLRCFYRLWVAIKQRQMPGTAKHFQQHAGMSAAAKSAIDVVSIGLSRKRSYGLLQHYRNMLSDMILVWLH
jgi:hypothetical protein